MPLSVMRIITLITFKMSTVGWSRLRKSSTALTIAFPVIRQTKSTEVHLELPQLFLASIVACGKTQVD